MRKQTLLVLSELFAIVANKNQSVDNQVYIAEFENFLASLVETEYIKGFVDYFANNLSESATGYNLKKLSLNSIKLIAKLEKLKLLLNSSERHYVFLYLIILSKKTGENKYSEDFIDEIAESFKINNELKAKIRDFIENSVESENLTDLILCIHDEIILFIPKSEKYLHNGQGLLANELQVLNKDSIITDSLGRNYFFSELKSLCGNYKEEIKFSLVAKNIEYKKQNKVLVQKTSVKFDSSQLVGILGNSGSGKTSFLKCISNFEKNYAGEIGFLSESDKNFKLSFVQQENSFVPKLSLEEHLYERAKFLQFDKQKLNSRIKEVLEFANIFEQKHNLVCKTDFSADQVSGGQQKRLAIATELLADPDVLLLDEPTSGLSSEDAYDIIAKLKMLTKQGKLVIAAIHQPELDLFLMFDKILVFDDGGYPVYYGKPQEAVEFVRKVDERIDKKTVFSLSKRPSILLNLLSEDKTKSSKNEEDSLKYKLYSNFRNKNKNIEKLRLETVKQIKKLNVFKTFYYYFRFGFIVDFKHKFRFSFMFILPLLAGVLLSFVTRYSQSGNYQYFYNPNIPVWILIILTTSIFVGLVSSGHEFIYLRKYINNNHKIYQTNLSHVLAVVFRYIIYSFVQTCILLLPAVFIVEISFHFFDIFIFSFLLCVWGSLLGLLLSYLLKTSLIVYLIIPLIIIPQLVYSGALIKFSDFNKFKNLEREIPLIADFIPMRWAAEGLIYQIYAENPYYSKLYKNRCNLYDAVYFAEIYVPELKDLLKNDSLQVLKILKQEHEEFLENFVNIESSLNLLENYYKSKKQIYLQNEDSIIASISNVIELKLKYSNSAVSNIVNYLNSGNFIKINDAKTYRNFKNIYSINDLKNEKEIYMVGYKSIGQVCVKTGLFNSFVLIFFNIFLLVSLIFIALFRQD